MRIAMLQGQKASDIMQRGKSALQDVDLQTLPGEGPSKPTVIRPANLDCAVLFRLTPAPQAEHRISKQPAAY